tara:strand:+ start:178 stop:1740 length:1563 start_codon:yes stop_codon:yes gene_type:complete
MAISLKRYDRQVGVSAQTGTQAISGGLASSLIQEAGMENQLIGDAIGVLGEAADTFFQHKAKGEVAKYEAYKQDWVNQLEVKKQQGLLEDGLKATELYDKVVLPEQRAFEKWVSDQKFSNLARQQIEPDVTNFGKKINASERLGLIQRQIEESNYNRQEEAQNYEAIAYKAQKDMKLFDPNSDEYKTAKNTYNQNTQLAEDIYEDLKRTTKVGVIDELRAANRYKRYNLEASLLTEELAFQRITPQQFQQEINNLRKELEADTIIDNSRKNTLESVLSGKVKSTEVTLARQAQQLESKVVKNINSEDGFTAEDAQQIKIQYGDTLGEKINQVILGSFAEVAVTNEDVNKLNEKVQMLIDTPENYEEFIEDAVKIGGKYAELAREVASIVISEMTDEDATISYLKINPSFSPMFGAAGKKIEKRIVPYNGWVKGIHKEIIDYTKLMPIGTDKEVKAFVSKSEGLMKQLIDYYYTNKTPSKDELSNLRSNMFGSLAQQIAEKTTILTTPTTKQKEKDPLGLL